ncbi:MAG TPA: choice-of-anchor tandem repeat GloVer-containing protein [Chthonomonas sp.]|uniref:choice-of-anchor tandem repeat GloVer-containing protein n=1 Tax=Chthonomonas sp. TaxID=2282153 RepID=UPI002B4AB728|nr:choice-of-anchor tandem repeat GloVer-containing protein [Chthonomonas sp.]HLI48390.1 choice-of-anchor tandem repeat GloVer-containing protein [Chthonomonas sp.]
MQNPHQDAVYRRYIFYSLLLPLLGLIVLAVVIAIGVGVLRQRVERWGAYQKGDFLNADGYHPVTIIRGDDGYIYGVTDSGGIYGHGVLYRLSPQNGAFRLLHTFDGTFGIGPYALMQAPDGWVYGAAVGNDYYACLTIYRFRPDQDRLEKAYVLGLDKVSNTSCLLPAGRGCLYGVSEAGGPNNDGVVYEVSLHPHEIHILHNFNGMDGLDPFKLIVGRDGMLYGVAKAGGSLRDAGTVFRVAPDGSGFKVLHVFRGTDGKEPVALIQTQDGELVGVADHGGRGDGVIFALKPDGTDFHIVHQFWPLQAGHMPVTILQAPDGELYGTAQLEGDRGGGDGIVYKMRPDGSHFQKLHIFRFADGALPFDLILDPSGSTLYGTTILGGQGNTGTVFKLNVDGQGFQTLHAFSGR